MLMSQSPLACISNFVYSIFIYLFLDLFCASSSCNLIIFVEDSVAVTDCIIAAVQLLLHKLNPLSSFSIYIQSPVFFPQTTGYLYICKEDMSLKMAFVVENLLNMLYPYLVVHAITLCVQVQHFTIQLLFSFLKEIQKKDHNINQ